MASDNLAKQLHDRQTRGESLSMEEQSLLEYWYALQDNAESNMLPGLTNNERTLATLQAQVEAAFTQLMTAIKRIQEVASENEALRGEIANLRHQLSHPSRSQAA